MRFMTFVTSDKPAAPTPALMEAMHSLANREFTAGRMIENGGLEPLINGARVVLSKGQVTVTDGPFVEAKVWSAATPSSM